MGGGFDRMVHCDGSSDYYDSFFQPQIKSADDLRAYCEKYKDQFPVLNDISMLLYPQTYSNLSIPMAVRSAQKTIPAPAYGRFLVMDVFSEEEKEEILQYNQLSGNYTIVAQILDCIRPPSLAISEGKGVETVSVAQYPAIVVTAATFTQHSPEYVGISTLIPAVTFGAVPGLTGESSKMPIVLPNSVLEHFSVKGDEISFSEFLDKHVIE